MVIALSDFACRIHTAQSLRPKTPPNGGGEELERRAFLVQWRG